MFYHFRIWGSENDGGDPGFRHPLPDPEFAELSPRQEQLGLPDVQDLSTISGFASQIDNEQAQDWQNGKFSDL